MRFALAILAVSTAAVASSAEAEPLTFRGPTMGTTYHVRFVPPDADPINPQQLQRDVEAFLADIDRQMSTYRDDSELSRFNRAAAGEWFAVSRATTETVAAAQEISRKTNGALDVTVGPLVRLWHFGPEKTSKTRTRFELPSDAALLSARKLVGYEKLEVRDDPAALRKLAEGLEIDLSSIAPGYAVDQIAKLFQQQGLKDFIVEIGGEIRAAGRRDDGKPWRVAIERPMLKRREMYAALALDDAAISTAGDYRKFFEHNGKHYSHIIDPDTGRPVEHALASVTVCADTCLDADGWDTALLVMGPERGFDYAEQHDIAALFIMRGKTSYSARITSAWKTRFETPN
jgi:thiamine biosynthesis lipoprotein